MNKKIVKQIGSLAIAGLLAFGAVGCGKTESENDEAEDNVATEDVEDSQDEVQVNDGENSDVNLDQIIQEEDSEDAIWGYANEAAPNIDISGCDTFTQIVDQKLESGMGYANVTIGDADALIVCSGAYDNMDGNMAAIDGTIFVYVDGVPTEIGKVCSGGTAYPLAITSDGKLMSASNHWVAKYLIVDNQLLMVERGAVEYDSEGTGNYEYDRIDDYSDGSEVVEAESMVNSMFDQMGDAEVINFDVIK